MELMNKSKLCKWYDSKGTLVYMPYGRSSAKRVLLTKYELDWFIPLISGTVTKRGVVFHAPFAPASL